MPKQVMSRAIVVVLAALALGAAANGQDGGPGTAGWRGNWTGLFPDANVPAEWSNISTGPAESLRCTTTQPADGSGKDAAPVRAGLIGQWLVIGPIAVEDAAKAFDAQQIAGEANLAPTRGQKAGELTWQYAEPTSDGVSFMKVKLTERRGKPRQAGYATTCLHAPKAGRLRAVVEHPVGMKVYVNGQVVYSDNQPRTVMGSAYGLSRTRLASTYPLAPSFEFDVRAGVNRMTVKLVSSNREAWNDLMFMMRVMDLPTARYERKNIAWMTPLPDRSNATPIVVGEKVFVMAEPDELICIDKRSGKVIWNALNGCHDAVPPAERDANTAFRDTLDPLARQVKETIDPVRRAELRRKLQDGLLAIDKKKYRLNIDGHLAGHFEIVGFTTTPCSDGKYVYVWTGAGVAACYDLDGRRQWIRRFDDKLYYSASPALIDGKLAVYFRRLYGLDARTGEVLWQQPEVNKTVASLLAGRVAGTAVFVSQQGEVIRAADGKMLWKNPAKITGDTGWCAPLLLGDVLYVPWYGIAMVFVVDFTGCAGDEWHPKVTRIENITAGVPRKKGDQGDPWMAASPLVYDGLLYGIDIHSVYYVVDLRTGKTLAQKYLDLPGEFTYVSLPVSASPTLVGKYIVVMDNQGLAVALEPGPACREIARNHLRTQIRRHWPITTLGYTSNSPPVADGQRMYLRGERYLYCVGRP